MKETKKGKMLPFFLSMVKIGCIGFGGGNALIPIMQKAVVDEEKVVSADEFEQDVLVANITPGALSAEVAAGVGKRIGGWKGMLIGSSGMALPGVLFTVFILSIMTYLDAVMLKQISFVTVGVTAVIMCLLTEYVVGTFRKAQYQERRWLNLAVVLLVFGVTCGKNLYRILGIERTPYLGIGTIHVFIVAFFLIFYLGNKCTWFGMLIALILSIGYILWEGQCGVISNEYVHIFIVSMMAALAIWGLVSQIRKVEKWNPRNVKSMLLELLSQTAVFAVSLGIAWLVDDKGALYVSNGFVSSIMSFGGGDAYLAVADGLFVESAIISEEQFYGNLVPLVNLLPGSILCKMLSGIGFCIGYQGTGSVILGYMLAATGFACSIVGSCVVISLVGCVYDNLECLQVFRYLRHWIRIIVSGLMLTVMLSLIWTNRKMGNAEAMGWYPVFVMLGIYGLDLWLYYKRHWKIGTLVLISSVLALVLCNLY